MRCEIVHSYSYNLALISSASSVRTILRSILVAIGAISDVYTNVTNLLRTYTRRDWPMSSTFPMIVDG
jgi:hypothetical protein